MRAGILELLRRLPRSAAFVVSAAYDVIAWNDLAAALMEDFSAVPRAERNLARRAFLTGQLWGVDDAGQFARSVARQLRATAARYPDDPGVAPVTVNCDVLDISDRNQRVVI
nr:hypothetical protein [uncultured Actinoplanes sp.]